MPDARYRPIALPLDVRIGAPAPRLAPSPGIGGLTVTAYDVALFETGLLVSSHVRTNDEPFAVPLKFAGVVGAPPAALPSVTMTSLLGPPVPRSPMPLTHT